MTEELRHKAAQIRLLALDVDGVLTDGGVYVLEDGQQFRRFDIKDGLGLKRLMATGVHVALISASDVTCVRSRAEALGITEVHLACGDKLAQLREISGRLGISLEQVAYVGDDLTDIPVLAAVGLPCSPADAADEVLSMSSLITSRAGGHGAVREVCDLVTVAHTE